MAGIISVRLPVRSFWQVATSVVGPVQIALLAAAFIVAVLFIQFAVVRLGAARIKRKRKSGNEVHR